MNEWIIFVSLIGVIAFIFGVLLKIIILKNKKGEDSNEIHTNQRR